MNIRRSTIAIDIPVLAATVLASTWLIAHTDLQIESALGLASSQWLYEMEWSFKKGNEEDVARGFRTPPLTDRERYAQWFPWSPIARLNQMPGIFRAEKAIEKWFKRGLPALAVAGVGLGIVAVRRPALTRRRDRWGPGRVSAAISLVVSSALLVPEFLLRRFNLMRYGDYHATLDDPLETTARVVGVAILAAWLLMAASGRWRRPTRWREGLGMALGGLWLMALAWLVVLAPLAQL